MLLDCWAIPSVMLLTWIFLKTKYGLKKIIGVVVCIAGLVLVIFSDVHAGDRAGSVCVRHLCSSYSFAKIHFDHIICVHAIGGSNPRKGDLLALAGATLYAISNVSEVS